MDVGELRPRQVNDEEDDQVQVLSNSNVQVDTNEASISGSHDNEEDQVQVHSKSNVQDDTNQASSSGSHDNEQNQVASTSSQPNDQASASIKFQYSN